MVRESEQDGPERLTVASVRQKVNELSRKTDAVAEGYSLFDAPPGEEKYTDSLAYGYNEQGRFFYLRMETGEGAIYISRRWTTERPVDDLPLLPKEVEVSILQGNEVKEFFHYVWSGMNVYMQYGQGKTRGHMRAGYVNSPEELDEEANHVISKILKSANEALSWHILVRGVEDDTL